MDEAGNTREDLTLPKGTEELDKVAEQIKEFHAEGRETIVTVLKVNLTSPSQMTFETNSPWRRSVSMPSKQPMTDAFISACGILIQKTSQYTIGCCC